MAQATRPQAPSRARPKAGANTAATLGDILTASLSRFRDRVAFRSDGREWTYGQTEGALARWVAVLRERGLQPGQGVGVLSSNRPEAWLGQVAPALAGGRYTPLHPLGSLDDQLRICDDAELRFLLVDPAHGERAADLLERSGAVEAVFTFGASDAGEDINRLADRIGAIGRLDPGPHRPDDVCFVLYTGGTTGAPKGVMLPERAVTSTVYGTAAGWDLPEPIRYLVVSPMSHFAAIPIMPTLMRGGTVVLQPRFDPGAWLAAVAAERPTLSLLVPTMIYALLDHPDLDSSDLSSLATVIYGGAPISPARLAEGIERVGPVFCQVYGQIEACGQGTALWRAQHDSCDLHRLSSCGTAIPFTKAAVLDEAAQPAADGVPGEICLRGASVMSGYWKQPKLTASTLADGWLHTGDIGTRDEDGFFNVIDRKKDMIVSGGFNVFPREVEDVLAQHRAVSAVAVIGVPDDRWGEAVKALVVLRPGSHVDEDELIALVRDRKGPVCAPKSVDFVDALPLTALGKPDKRLLRGRYWQGRSRQVG